MYLSCWTAHSLLVPASRAVQGIPVGYRAPGGYAAGSNITGTIVVKWVWLSMNTHTAINTAFSLFFQRLPQLKQVPVVQWSSKTETLGFAGSRWAPSYHQHNWTVSNGEKIDVWKVLNLSIRERKTVNIEFAQWRRRRRRIYLSQIHIY